MLLLFCKLLLVCITAQISFTDQPGSYKVEQNSSSSLEDADCHFIYLLTLLPKIRPKTFDERSEPELLSMAAELAVQHINEDQNTLPAGYRVKLIHADSGCDKAIIPVISFIENVYNRYSRERPIAGVIGPACSESAITISSIANRAGLSLPIVHIASSAELEDREKYPHTFGILGSTFQLVEALFSFMRHNRVDKIAVLYEDSREFLCANCRLRKLINSELSSNGGIIVFHSAIYDTFFPIQALQKSEAYIFVVISALPLAQKMICIAFSEGISFYQWVVVSHSYYEFKQGRASFIYHGTLHECNFDAVNPSLDNVLFVYFSFPQGNSTTIPIPANKYRDIRQQYVEKVCHNNTKSYSSILCPFPQNSQVTVSLVYDAVWAIVLALNKTAYVPNNSVDDLVAFDNMINFQCIHFKGVSGYIHFEKSTGFVQRFIDVAQIRDGEASLVGSISSGNITLYNTSAVFISVSQQYLSVNPFASAFFILIELILLLITIFIHIVSLIYRQYPSIKAASPVLNQFTFASCYLTIVCALLFISLKTFGLADFNVVGNICHSLWAWLYPTTVTLGVGVLQAKTWRIYRIFIHFRNPGPFISNKALITIVLVQLTLDMIVGTAWSVISPIKATVVEGGSYVNHKRQIIVQRQCVFTNTIYCLVTLGVYKFLQVLSLLMLCILTRSVKDRKFSTNSLTAGTYLTLLLTFVLFPLYVVLWFTNAEIHADFVVLCVFFGGNTLILLTFVLIPPTLPLLKTLSNCIHCK